MTWFYFNRYLSFEMHIFNLSTQNTFIIHKKSCIILNRNTTLNPITYIQFCLNCKPARLESPLLPCSSLLNAKTHFRPDLAHSLPSIGMEGGLFIHWLSRYQLRKKEKRHLFISMHQAFWLYCHLNTEKEREKERQRKRKKNHVA